MSNTYMQNRELSWLKFNERVLQKGTREDIPLYEKLKFLSIFDSNLTEFFNVRVGSLTDFKILEKDTVDSKTGMTVSEQLDAIYNECVALYKERDSIYDKLEEELRQEGIGNLKYHELNEQEKIYVDTYFEKNIMPMISPNVVDKHHPFPFLENNAIYIMAVLKTKKKKMHLILPIRAALPQIIRLPHSNNYILIEELIVNHLEDIVPNFEIGEKYIVRLTRNADIDLELSTDEEIDYKDFVQKKLKNRRRLLPVRLEVNSELKEFTKKFIINNLELSEEKIFVTTSPLKMSYVWSLGNILDSELIDNLSYEKYTPRMTNMIDTKYPLMNQIEKHDVFLSYPFESMDTLINLLKEASKDDRVFSIKITLYRMASNSKVIKYLLRAADEGKEVTVAVELRARFDENNNIDYSEELIEGGVNVIYGVEKYKVHSKICLITYTNEDNNIKYITHIGTGNYNESTAKLYQDMNVITSNKDIGIDATNFFNNLQIAKIDNKYNYLLQSPSTFKQKILDLMQREIEKGPENGYIRLKCNSLTDKDIIKKISEASNAGIKVDMVVRGICCIIPGVQGKTENVTVISIVGRYLEHARIYQFGKNERSDIYIASADLMTRNTERRVEIGLPIMDKDIKRYLIDYLNNQFLDTVNAKRLLSDKTYERVKGEHFDSHKYHMEIVENYLYRPYKENDSKVTKEDRKEYKKDKVISKEKKKGFFEKLLDLFRN